MWFVAELEAGLFMKPFLGFGKYLPTSNWARDFLPVPRNMGREFLPVSQCFIVLSLFRRRGIISELKYIHGC